MEEIMAGLAVILAGLAILCFVLAWIFVPFILMSINRTVKQILEALTPARPPAPPRPAPPKATTRPAPQYLCPDCGKAIPEKSIVIGENTCPHCGGKFEAEDK